MPDACTNLKLLSALAVIAGAGPAVAQRTHDTAASSISNPPVTLAPVDPCPRASAVTTPRHFLVVNRTDSTLACRVRSPAIGGWSPLVSLSPGARLIDKPLDLEEIHVQCKSPVIPGAVRVFPGGKYSLLRQPGSSEVALLKIKPGS